MAALHDTHAGQPPSLEAIPSLAALAQIYSVQSKMIGDEQQPSLRMPPEETGVQEWLRLRNPEYSLA